MPLWTDIIDPADLTGYARASLADYERTRGSLAQFLPNREVADVAVRFVMGRAGLVEEARWRAYDAEPEVGTRQPTKRVTVELPAVSQTLPVSEYEQLRLRNANDDTILNNILATTDTVVRAVADAVERLRGVAINTGRATINQGNFTIDDDFGRAAGHTVTLGTLWTTATADRIAALTTLTDLYRDENGEDPGVILGSTRAFRALASGDQFRVQLVGGGSRPATDADTQAIVQGAGFPAFLRYDRRTKLGRVLPDDRIFLLPAPVGTDAWQDSELGATFWGQTLTSTLPDFGLADGDQPGLVVGTYRNEKPPAIAEVVSDAIAMPVLANANLSLSAKVL